MNCIKAEKCTTNNDTGEIRYSAIINPNKWNGNVTSYEKLNEVLYEIAQDIGISSYRLSRVDFAMDFMEDNYNELFKLNKCICLLLSGLCNMQNRYESINPLTLELLTIRVQSEYYECENYNKNIESNQTSPVYNRLELRSKALLKTKKGIKSSTEDWYRRLTDATKGFDQLQAKCNEFLLQKWENEKYIKVKDDSEFIRKCQDNIFTAKQLKDLYRLMGFNNPESKAKNFKRYNKIEFFSYKDLEFYVNDLKIAMKNYMEG